MKCLRIEDTKSMEERYNKYKLKHIVRGQRDEADYWSNSIHGSRRNGI